MNKKISRFEFAILQTIEPEKAKKIEQYTEQEERSQRINKINCSLLKLKIKKTDNKSFHPDRGGDSVLSLALQCPG